MIMTSDVMALAVLNAYFTTGQDLKLHLYTNNYAPTDVSTVSSFTEAAGGGYAAITLTGANFTNSIVGGIAQAAYATQTFTFTGPLTDNAGVYGYYVTDSTNTYLLWAEQNLDGNDDPYAIPVSVFGDHIDITPVYKLSKGTPT